MSAICIADLHLSHLVPVCRKETPEQWIEHQRNVLKFIAYRCNSDDSNLYIAGDIFDKSSVSDEVVNIFLDFVNSIHGSVYILKGNHDMRNRSHDTNDTSFGIVERAYAESDKVSVSNPGYGMPYTDDPVNTWGINIIPGFIYMVHTLCYETQEQCTFGGCSAQELLNKFPHTEYIVVGDQHHGFHYENDGKHVINCGCILKRNVDFKDQKLYIWKINKDRSVVPIELPEDNGVYNEHRIEITERDGRITLLMEKLAKSTNGVSIDFVQNLLDGLTDAQLSEYTEKVIRKLVEVQS